MEEKIMEMLRIQQALNKKYMGDKPDISKVKTALFDGLGTINHEMKAEWL